MSSRSTIELGTGKPPHRVLSDLVMAWAHDSRTKGPRYILELGPEQRGAKCACICVGCGEPLIAVNAAKTEFVRRPHFRHFEGVERGECLVLAARAAALRQLGDSGWIDLPRRCVSGRISGLSGEFYEAWVEHPNEKLRITQVDYRDRATAIFTFEDGRTLSVELTGSAGAGVASSGGNSIAAAILISVDDPVVAAMDPEEIRRHLTLLPDAFCWRSHWADAALLQEAEDYAREEAKLHLDYVPSDLMLPPGMDANLKRESILHYFAKRILAEEGRVAVPELLVEVEVADSSDSLHLKWTMEADVFKLDQIEIEERYGDIVPDLTCKAHSEDGVRVYVPMFIEITVSNAIDEERLSRIRAKKCLALEIDLSLAGGRVTREELRRLVVEELATKRWLYHPEAEEQREKLLQQLHFRAKRRAVVLATPVGEIGGEYLEALIASLTEDREREQKGEAVSIRLGTAADERLAEAIDKLTIHGFPEAGASMLIAPHGILDRILSIKADNGIGYRLASGQAVLNAIKQDRAEHRAYHSLFLIAALKYQPKLTQEQRSKLDEWRTDVRASLKAGELTYRRPPIFDRLLSLLLPEIASDLDKPGAKRDSHRHAGAASTQRHETYDRNPAVLVYTQPRSDAASWPLRDTSPGDWWFKGRDLARWKRQNPQWAACWGDEGGPSQAKED